MEGYRSVSLKGEVVEKLQKRAKKEDKKLSPLLEELLEERGGGEKLTKKNVEEITRKVVRDEVTAILEEMKRW